MTIDEYNKSVDLYSDNVYRFILKNVKDEALAQDVVQDSYEKLWLNYKNVQSEKVKSYLFTTAYRTMIDILRRAKKITNTDISEFNNHFHNDQYSDIGEILNIAINKLPNEQKAVIMLRDYEGYSYNEIAEITGLNESQVKVYIYRARVALKKYIVNVENLA